MDISAIHANGPALLCKLRSNLPATVEYINLFTSARVIAVAIAKDQYFSWAGRLRNQSTEM